MVSSSWNPPACKQGVWLLAACLALLSCNSPQKLALRELSKSGVDASGRSLVKAVLDRDAGRAALLLEAGVYTEQRDARGRTPLAIAVECRDFPMVAMLLNADADVNASLANQTSVLGLAAECGNWTMIETLLAAGASSSGLMPDGDMILPWSIRNGRSELLRTLMKANPDPHLKDQRGNPLLHIAMECGRRDLMESLLELGADPGATNAAGETTLQLALRHGWTDVLPKLASAGADPNAAGPDGHTLLENAVASDNRKLVALLLKIGADANHCGPEESLSPWSRIFPNQDPGMLEVFLKHGAKPPQDLWDSWIWQTYLNHNLNQTRFLLKYGPLPSHPRAAKLPLIETATLAGNADFIKLMLDYGCPPGRSLILATLRDDHQLVDLLLACGLSPNLTLFPSKDTLLSAAIRHGHDRVADLLIEHGAPTHLALPEGQNPFLLAIATGCPLTVKRLLDTGANPNESFSLPVSPAFLKAVRPGPMRWILKMDRNATPLMLAADSGNIQTALYLIKAGAKVEVHTRFSDIWPINLASDRKDVGMMRLFLGQDPWREKRNIEIRLSEQEAVMFDDEGHEIFKTKVSTGRAGFATPTGEYVITNKHREWTSTLYHASMPFFQRLSGGDFGLHQGNVPGYPASHGCIRVPAGKASKLFGMTQTGDRVTILP